MTEAEWMASDSPEPMLMYLRGRASDRKLRLFAVACIGMIRHLITADCSREVIRLAEAWADDPSRASGVQEALGRNYALQRTLYPDPSSCRVITAAITVGGLAAWAAAWQVTGAVRENIQPSPGVPIQAVAPQQAELLRHVIGNPFTALAFDPHWRTREVIAIAQAAYEDRRWDDLPFAADALEDAGCADAAILAHLRGPGPHVRGCFAVDLCLGLS